MEKRTKIILASLVLFLLVTLSSVYAAKWVYCDPENCDIYWCWCEGETIIEWDECCFACEHFETVKWCCGYPDGCFMD